MMNRLSTLPPRALDGIGIAMVLCIAGGAYVLGVAPALDRRAAAESDRQTLAAELVKVEEAAKAVKDSLRIRDELLAARGEALVLEPAAQVNGRIAGLTALASSEQIEIQQLTPGAPVSEKGKPFTAVPIKLQGTGGFADCVAFLRRIREEYRDIAVPTVGLAISTPASENQAARLDMTLGLVWYAAPEDSAGR